MEVYELEELGLRVFWDPPTEPGELADCIHRHGFCELHIPLENGCILQTDSGSMTVEPGQFCLIAPHVSHATQSPPHSFRRLILSFEKWKRSGRLGTFLAGWMESCPVYVGCCEGLRALASQFAPDRGEFRREHTQGLLQLLFVELGRSLGTVPDSGAVSAATADQVRTMVMDDFLNRHFAQNNRQEALAAALGLSRRQLDRVMHSHYGMGYQEKISRIRLEVACDLLERTTLSVREIAQRVGYSDASNFTVFFRRCRGETPTQYRKSLRM